jgi:hypothetical protein
VKRVVQELPDAHGIVGDVSRKEDTHPIAMQILGALGGLDGAAALPIAQRFDLVE